MQGCSLFYDDGNYIRYMNVLEFGDLMVAGRILHECYKTKEDVEKPFEYIWLKHLIKPDCLLMVSGFKGKNIKFLDIKDIQDFVKNKDIDISCAYYYKDGIWYHTDNNKEGGWELLSDEIFDINMILKMSDL